MIYILPASSTTKTGRHDIAEILLKVTLNTKIQSKSINLTGVMFYNKNRESVEVIEDLKPP
jgi:hypothetical protein